VTRLRWKTLFPLEGSLSSKREMTSHPPDPKKIYKRRRSWWKNKLKKKKVCFLLIQLNPPWTHTQTARDPSTCVFCYFSGWGFYSFFKSATGGPIEKMSPPTTRWTRKRRFFCVMRSRGFKKTNYP
jgi:hypothetical protein